MKIKKIEKVKMKIEIGNRRQMRLLFFLIVLSMFFCIGTRAENYNVHMDGGDNIADEGNIIEETENAENTETDYYKEIYDYANSGDMIENIPDTAKEYIELESNELRLEDVTEKFNFGFIFSTITALLGKITPAAVKSFLPVIALILLSAIVIALKDAFESESFSDILSFILIICFSGSVFFAVKECFELARTFLEEIHLYMLTMVPIMASLSAVSGNVAAAAVNSAGIYAALNIVNIISTTVIFPVLQICYSLTLAKSLTNTVNLDGVASYIRSVMNWIFIFIMTTLITVLLFQNILASSADTIAARTVKFTVSSFIPVVGGVISEATRAIIGSIGAVKSVTGIFGILVIALTLLPPLITVILNKFMLSLAGAFALILGMDKQAGFLKEMNSLLDITLAIMTAVSVIFIFSITIFIQTSAA